MMDVAGPYPITSTGYQYFAGGERAKVLNGSQGVAGSGPGTETLQMLPLWTEDHSQCRELAAQE